MSLLAFVVSHTRTPLDELERIAVSEDALARALPCLVRAPDVREAVVLSTCNRTEVYAWVGEPELASDQIRLFLEDLNGLPPGWTRTRGTVLTAEEVIRHLFSVTAGLDSMVVGESEIQGQVKGAYRNATSLGTVGPHLHGLFRWALESGKKARSQSGLAGSRDSFPRAAVRAIGARFGGDLAGRAVLVVGNGRMARSLLHVLAVAGARVSVTARRLEAAEELAGAFAGSAVPLPELGRALASADAAVFATSAPEPLIGADQLSRVLAAREGEPLVVVDLGLPRNVGAASAGALGEHRGWSLYDLERLDEEGHTVLGGRRSQIAAASRIVVTESERCIAWFKAKPADAVVAAIRAQANHIAEREAETGAARIPGLDDRQRAAVEEAIRRTVRKVVHLPTVRTKEACARGDDALLEAARWLFGVDGDAPAAHPAREGVTG